VRARIREANTGAVVKLSGKISVGAGDLKLEEIVGSLLESGKKRIVLDLERVSYLDSSGLGSMVACQKAAAEKDAELVLLRPTGKVLDVLILTGLKQFFAIFQDESVALAGPAPAEV